MADAGKGIMADASDSKEANPWDTPIKNMAEADGDPEPSCFSSWGEFKYRTWELFARWRSILCC